MADFGIFFFSLTATRHLMLITGVRILMGRSGCVVSDALFLRVSCWFVCY